jgi:hypothetical protein
MDLVNFLSGKFDPKKAQIVTSRDLKNIFSGRIKNPHKDVDYSFFLAGTDKITEPQRVDSINNVVDFFYGCEWFGKFYCKRDSRIVLPNSAVICFDPIGKQVIGEKVEGNVWSGGGYFQLDKEVFDLIIPTVIPASEMLGVFNKVYC